VPNYRAFWVAHRWGDPILLEYVLEGAWAFCGGSVVAGEEAAALMEKCKAIAPDNDKFGSAYSVLAINAVGAIFCLLHAYQNDAMEQVAAIAKTAVYSAEYYVMVANWPGKGMLQPEEVERTEAWITASPLVRAEIDKQGRDIVRLQNQTILDTDFLLGFRREATVTGIDPIGRGLIVVRE
jgi:uncharacterized protein YjaG (DUF416 family)